MKYSFFTKIFSLIIIGTLLSSVILIVAFNHTNRRALIGQNHTEMVYCATFLADIVELHFSEKLDPEVFDVLLVEVSRHFMDYYIYAFDSEGTLVWDMKTPESDVWIQAVAPELETALDAKFVVSIPYEGEPDAAIIAAPTRSDTGEVNGAVFLVCPINRISGLARKATLALLFSLAISCLILVVPAYLASRALSRPIKQMTESAKAIAKGDFSVKVPKTGDCELSQLGESLSYMAGELSATISDLTVEKNRLDTIINGLTEGIIASNAAGQVTHCNDAAQRLLSEGNDMTDFRETKAFGELHTLMEQAFNDKRTLSSAFSAEEGILHFTVSPLYEHSGGTAGVVALIKDITESEQLEATRREYVANVSHELRTPIAAVRSLADALNDGLIKDDTDKQRYYGYILKESLRLSRLIDDLLDLSRLQADNMRRSDNETAAFKTALLSEIASEAIAVTLDAHTSSRRILTDFDPISLKTNPDRMEQLFLILLDNAFRHSSDGDIEFKIKAQGNKAVISVSNEGRIACKDLPHLFERFYKTDKSHSGNGTGLGLAIAAEIVELLSGEIFAESSHGHVRFTAEFDIIN